jgi:hypothetical protein
LHTQWYSAVSPILANGGWGWGWTPDPQQIGGGTPTPDLSVTPTLDPRQIGGGGGGGDRGFRALVGGAFNTPESVNAATLLVSTHLSVARHVMCVTHSTPGCSRIVDLPSREQGARSWVETQTNGLGRCKSEEYQSGRVRLYQVGPRAYSTLPVPLMLHSRVTPTPPRDATSSSESATSATT